MNCKTSIIGSVNWARRKIPDCLKSKKPSLYSTNIYEHESISTTLTVYQGKKQKNVIVLITLHSNVTIAKNEKKTPEIVGFCNETKCSVDLLDQMAKKYFVKSGSKIHILKGFRHCSYRSLDYLQFCVRQTHFKAMLYSTVSKWIALKLRKEYKMCH